MSMCARERACGWLDGRIEGGRSTAPPPAAMQCLNGGGQGSAPQRLGLPSDSCCAARCRSAQAEHAASAAVTLPRTPIALTLWLRTGTTTCKSSGKTSLNADSTSCSFAAGSLAPALALCMWPATLRRMGCCAPPETAQPLRRPCRSRVVRMVGQRKLRGIQQGCVGGRG